MDDRTSAVLCVERAAVASTTRARSGDLPGRLAAREAELAELEPVVAAAMVTATAFRLRDEAGLIAGLRELVRALDQLAAEPGDD